MNDVYFRASLQNTLNPEVGTFDNVDNKEGTFTLEDGEYYLTNNTSTSYRVYYPTKNLYSVGFTIEFDVNYNNNNGFNWCLLFTGDDSEYWNGFGVAGTTLQFRGKTLLNYDLITSPHTWLHVKCTFDYNHDLNQNIVCIYIDNVKVNTFTISNNYGIKFIDILGNNVGFVADAKIKNIIIYDSNKHYLDTIGLTSLWSKIKSLFATKSDLTNYYTKSEVTNLLSNYYTKKQIDIMLKSAGSDKYGESIMATEAEGSDDAPGGLSFWNVLERAPGYDGTSQMNIAEDSNTVEDE